jgi:hypothetical protein
MFFQRDTKFYIGPLSDVQIDSLQARPELRSSGIACMAWDGKVETYLTIPAIEPNLEILRDLKRMDIINT